MSGEFPGVEVVSGGLPRPEGVRGGDVPQGGGGEAHGGAVPPTMVEVVDALDVEIGEGLRYEFQFWTTHRFFFPV